MSDTVYSINGPVITVRNTKSFAMREMTYVGKKHLLGEVIKVNDDCTTIQVYESTTGLRPGEEVIGTGSLLNATLGPGLLKNIYDGIERPLQKIEEIEGAFISEGSQVDAIDTKVKWDVTMLIKEGDVVTAGEIFATCQETSVIEHRSMIPNGVHGVAKNVKPSGSYTVNDVLAVVEDEETGKQTEITLAQKWPVRIPRPIKARKPLSIPLVTGQRVLDTMFPIAKGGSAAVNAHLGVSILSTIGSSARLTYITTFSITPVSSKDLLNKSATSFFTPIAPKTIQKFSASSPVNFACLTIWIAN